tara:strand:+ start:46 stop:819 length:774 start_codon:yes stop_codon:yes gene_type:complete
MTIKFIILGSGSSMGVPRADGHSGNCDLKNLKNHRSRCSALIKFNEENFLIDTSPDLRQQMISNKIRSISKVFYTHMHADQTHGINDLRPFYITKKKKLPVYANDATSKYLYSTFKYCFKSTSGYPSTLNLNILKKKHTFKNKNKKILLQAIPVKHGKIESLCYIVNKKLAYAPDTSLFYKKDLKLLKNLSFFVIDCLWYKNHPAHFNLDQVLDLVKIINPKRTILTNMHSDIDFNSIKKKLPKNVVPGFDGMTLKL